MSERTRRNSLTYHEQRRDAESECVPCKLCGGKAIITDAGPGFGYNIECENAARFTQQSCLQSGTRISGWAYNVSDMWNRLNALTPQINTVAEMIRQAVDDVTGLHLVIAAIREATVGGKPMLSDLPAALRGWQKTAVLAEREACAELAHDWQNETGTDIAAAARICPQIAHAIRARGKA